MATVPPATRSYVRGDVRMEVIYDARPQDRRLMKVQASTAIQSAPSNTMDGAVYASNII